MNVGIDFFQINDSKILFNVFAGDYTGITFEVSQVGSSGNTIQNNTISGIIPDNLGTPTLPSTSSEYTDLIKLADSHHNTIAHNVAFVPGSDTPGIPSYDLYILLGVTGVVSAWLIVKNTKKKRETT